MKKIYTLAAGILISAGLIAQSNLGFETWAPGNAAQNQTTDPHPTGWGDLQLGPGYIDNDMVPFLQNQLGEPGATITIGGAAGSPTTQVTSGAAQGSSAIKLQTFTLSGLTTYTTFNGIYGSEIEQSFATTTRTAKIAFEYKSNLGTDTAVAFLNATGPSGGLGPNGDIIGQGESLILGTHSSWTADTMEVTYYATAAIDTMKLQFSSSISAVLSGHATPAVDGGSIQIDNIQFLTPPTPAGTASNITLSDISNNDNGTDLQVTFNAATNENTVSEYRIYALYAPNAATIATAINAEGPSAIPASDYISVTPSGNSTYTTTFNSTSPFLEVSGMSLGVSPIVNDTSLKVLIVSMPDGTNATEYALSSLSDTITLRTTTGIDNLRNLVGTISVAPNPATNFANFNLSKSAAYNLIVTNLTGKVVENTQFNGNSYRMDMSNLADGMYIYTLRNLNTNKVLKGKLVKE